MKTRRILVLGIFFAMLVSCDSEKDALSIEGKWKLVQSESYDCDLATDNGVKTCGTFAWCVTVDFKSDNTFEIFRSSDNVKVGSGNYVFSNGVLATSAAGSSGTTYPVTLSGNTLVVTTESTTASCSTNDTYQRI